MQDLLRGGIMPGHWLRQDELAERLGVSKIPVREALQRMVASGLLRMEPNRGVVVPQLTAAEAEEIFGLRRGIEPQLLERALPMLSIVHLAEAEVALGDDRAPVAEANWAFHAALYRASGWERGVGVAEILHVAVAPYVALYTEELDGGTHSHDEHRAILDACRAGDGEWAVQILLSHLGSAERTLARCLAR